MSNSAVPVISDGVGGSMRHISVIAEIGSAHDGSFGNAKCLVDSAAECGVDAVKFQTHIAGAETLRDAPMPSYFKGEPRFEYFERTAFSEDQWRELSSYAGTKGVQFLSSPFSVEAVDLLESVGVQQYKIPSGEVTNLPLLERIAETGKPILLSSGMSSWEELDEALVVIRKKHDSVTLMQCTSAYPCQYECVGLNVIQEMRDRYGLPVGFSDHTLTNYAAFAAVVLGVSVVEKHFALSRHMYGSDAHNAAEPAELADLVRGVRALETMLTSDVDKADVSAYTTMKETFEKSIVSLSDILADTILTRDNIGVKKPGTGLPAKRFGEVLGKRACRDVPADTLLQDSDLADN